MANDVYATIRHYRSCSQNRTHGKEQRQLNLFFLEGTLKFICMGIQGLLPKTRQGSQFVVVMTDRYTKQNKSTRTTATKVTTVVYHFLECWVVSYSITSQLLTNNGPQSLLKFFLAVCSTLELYNITTTEYQSQTNNQTELFSSAIIP